jgi:Ca-activated chloride channel family protein
MSAPLQSGARWTWLYVLGLLAALLACDKKEPAPQASPLPEPSAAVPANVVELSFVYGSEKKAWLEEAIAEFNTSSDARPDGMTIQVKGSATGSGSAVDDIVDEAVKPDLWCPASDLFRPMLNRAWAAKHGTVGGGKPVAPEGKQLVLSPVVIAMWKPMAEALGWPGKSVGWSDILKLSKDPKGWATLGHPEWGLFKLGHTHPEYSNSGLMSVLAEAYAAIGQTRGLDQKKLDDKKTLGFLESIEGSIVHYGKSTGFFADKMLKRGPRFLSAAVVYENLVIDAYERPEYKDRELDLVAIYPKEGTFWIDNPLIIMDAPWVDAKKKKAAEAFQKYLLGKDVQTKAMQKYGFRPSDPSIAVTAPLDAAHGVDPKQPKTLLETPDPDLVAASLKTWQKTKKTVDLMFVFDRSGSMRGEPLKQAKAGASEFLKLLDDRDRVSLVVFNDKLPDPIKDPAPLGSERQSLLSSIDGTFADGGTALYDAIQTGHDRLAEAAKNDPKRIHALVALTDGRDENSKITLETLKQTVTSSSEMGTSVRVFTIAYGSGADATVLGDIAESGGGALFKGNASTIRQIYRDLAAFF